MMPVIDNSSNNNNAANGAFTVSQMEPADISNLASQFVVQYYNVMKKYPSVIHRFYKDDSSMIHEDAPVYGQRMIHEKITSLGLQHSRIAILRLDALRASADSVLIQVAGEISANHEDFRRFTQTFILRQQAPCDFYVLSDIFRFQDYVYGDVKSNDMELNNVQVKKPNVENSAPSHPVNSADRMERIHNWHDVSDGGYQKDVTQVNNHEDIIEQSNTNHIPTQHVSSPPQTEFINSPQSDGAMQMPSAPPQQRSWAQMVSRQAQPAQNIQGNKPFRPNVSVTDNQVPDEHLRGGIKQAPNNSHPNQRLRGAASRQNEFRSAPDGNCAQDNRGSARGGSMRGSARGGRGHRGGSAMAAAGHRRGN